MTAIEKDYFIKYDDQTYMDMWQPVNGIFKEFCLQDNGITVESFSGWGLPQNDNAMVKSAYVDGEFISASKLGTRTLTMNIFSDGCNREDYWNTRRQLVEHLYNYSGAIQNNISPQTPTRYNQDTGDGYGVWEERWTSEYIDPIVHPKIYPSAPTAFKYTNGNIGPLVWAKDINGKKYHTYVHYKGGADFSPRDLEQWKEWSVEESLSFEAYDPFVYLSEPRVMRFSQTSAAPINILFEYFGNARAKPVIELYDFAKFLLAPGDWVKYVIGFRDLSELADPYTRFRQKEEIVIKVTYEMVKDFYSLPVLDSSLRLILNFSRRGTGVWLASRESIYGPAPQVNATWRMYPLESAIVSHNLIVGATPLNMVDSLRNFSLVGFGPSKVSLAVPDPSGSTNSWKYYWFDDDATEHPSSGFDITMSHNLDTIPLGIDLIKGSCVFYETYGGL